MEVSLSLISVPKTLTFDITLTSFSSMFIISLVWFPLFLSKIISQNLAGLTIKWSSLNHFIATSLSDSRMITRFSIILANFEKVLSSGKSWAEATNIKIEKVVEKMLNRVGPTIDRCRTPDIISSQVILILLTHYSLLFKSE